MIRASASVVEARGYFGFLPLFVFELLALVLDLSESRLRGLHALISLASCSLVSSSDAPIAGIRAGLDLVFEFLDYRLGGRQMPVKRLLAPERACPGVRPDPHAILRQRLELDPRQRWPTPPNAHSAADRAHRRKRPGNPPECGNSLRHRHTANDRRHGFCTAAPMRGRCQRHHWWHKAKAPAEAVALSPDDLRPHPEP